MKKIIHAIYEHGVLRPLEPLEEIAEKSEVALEIEYPLPSPERYFWHPSERGCG